MNPTFQELAEAQYDGRGGFRAFLLLNGKMIAWGTEFHQTIRKITNEVLHNSIPITGRFKNRSKVDVVLSNEIIFPIGYDDYDIDQYDDYFNKTKENVRNHRHFKKLFSKMVFDGDRFRG